MYLGIDCGTQGTKALILDTDSGQVLGQGAAPHTLISGANGRREQDTQQWLDACVLATRQALAAAGVDGARILGVGVSGQQHGLVLLDIHGQVLRPAKLWCDTESSAENDRLLRQMGGVQGSLTRLGLAIAPGYTVSKLLWTREQHPEVFARIAHILLPHEYLNYWLSGRCCSEQGDASGTGYFNVRTRQWDLDLLASIGAHLPAALPQLIEPRQAVGTVLPGIAQQLGISPQAVVASGGGDNMMGAIGTGNIVPGILTMSLGSSGTVYAYADTAQVSPEPEVATFCASSGGWLPLICTQNLTNATTAVRELFALGIDAFNQQVETAPIGCEGVLMLPFLNGERVPALPHASGSFQGLTSTNLNPANLCRAAVEGTTFGLRYGLDLLRDSGVHTASIRLIGGGAKSAAWRQMVANIMNTHVVCPQQPEAAALGAALQAAWCVGTAPLAELCERCVHLDPHHHASPRAEDVARYEAVYRHYRHAITTL